MMHERATALAALAALAWVVLALAMLLAGWGSGGILGLLLPLIYVAIPPVIGFFMMREIMRLRANLARIEAGMGAGLGSGPAAARRAQARQGGVAPLAINGQDTARSASPIAAKPGASPRREPPPASVTTATIAGNDSAQPGLDLRLAGHDAGISLPAETLLRALDFPSGADDREGLAAQRAALGEVELGRLIRATQDVLVLLADDRIFVDALDPPGTPAEAWRDFAGGVRRQGAARLGAGATADLVEQLVGRMRADIVFRDAAHHFIRLFDRFLGMMARTAQDDMLCAMMRTRSGLAFRLLGQAAGSFG